MFWQYSISKILPCTYLKHIYAYVLFITKSYILNEYSSIRVSYTIHQTIALLQLFAIALHGHCNMYSIIDDECQHSRNSIISCRDSKLLQQFTTETKNSSHKDICLHIPRKSREKDISTEAKNIPNISNNVCHSRKARVHLPEQTTH